eukprot:c1293_g1_i1 orf=2-241(-)
MNKKRQGARAQPCLIERLSPKIGLLLSPHNNPIADIQVKRGRPINTLLLKSYCAHSVLQETLVDPIISLLKIEEDCHLLA